MQSRSPPQRSRAGKPPERRRRVPLSCDPCRMRKLKCNREQPCQNCMARNQEATCYFHGSKNVPLAHREASGQALRQRVDHLEGLVKRLIAERQEHCTLGSNTPHAAQDVKAESDGRLLTPASNAVETSGQGTGKTIVDGIHSVYMGGDDWHAVLDEIHELKANLDQDVHDQMDRGFDPTMTEEVDGTSLLFNQVKPIDCIEILSSLPPKPEVDRLISWFFGRQNFPINIPPLLHEATFMREYNEHWKNPTQTEFIWLGLLFSILGMTMIVYTTHGEPPEYEGKAESFFQLYRMRTAQCLLSGDISKCLPYTVETLRFNATAELNRRDDNRRALWIMTGVIIRAAISQGYHRDPSHSPGFSSLQAEYRRRVWAAVVSMDDMTSFLGGFPRMMPTMSSDTLEPRNLHEWEMEEDMITLPSSRPLAERTSATYLIVKTRLCRALGRVADFNSTPNLGAYEVVTDIDRELCEVYDNFPSHMKPAFNEDGIISTANGTDFSNLGLVCMYHRGMCVLHRRFLAKNRTDSRFRLSRDRCIASALALLRFQQGLTPTLQEAAAARQLLTLAAMVLFLELEARRKMPDVNAEPDSDVILQTLKTSIGSWSAAVAPSDDAKRAFVFLDRMLSDFDKDSSTTSATNPLETGESSLAMWPEGSSLGAAFPFEQNLSMEDFDWTTWDTFIDAPGDDPNFTY